jgi:cell division protein FtsZ
MDRRAVRLRLGGKSGQESKKLQVALAGADLCFIAAGWEGEPERGRHLMWPILSRKWGGLSIAVVTKPFSFEGRERIKVAEAGAQGENKS